MPIQVVQCWDDGVVEDLRLAEMLRRHGAKATFNLNGGNHKKEREGTWRYEGHLVKRLALSELREVYDGFEVANHTLTHPHLLKIPRDEVIQQVVDGRAWLQDFFQQEVPGFVYPGGGYSEAVMEIVRDAGHSYARTTKQTHDPLGCNPFAFHPTCEYKTEDFWDRYAAAKADPACRVFYFWGHSYQLLTETMWADLEDKVSKITADPDAEWGNLSALF